jgi:hypothetical protein
MKFIKSTDSDQSVNRLQKAKLACRVGMIYLKPRATLWAYKKQIKQLNTQLSTTTSKLQVNHRIEELKTKKQSQSQETQQDDLSYF